MQRGSLLQEPVLEFMIYDTLDDAREDQKLIYKESTDPDSDFYAVLQGRPGLFIRPVRMESGSADFSDANWVIIERNSATDELQGSVTMFHTYDDLGNVPKDILLQLHKMSPNLLLARFTPDSSYTTFKTKQIAQPILTSLRAYILKSEQKEQ